MWLTWNWIILSILPFLPMKDDLISSNQHHLFMSDQNNVYFNSSLSSYSTLKYWYKIDWRKTRIKNYTSFVSSAVLFKNIVGGPMRLKSLSVEPAILFCLEKFPGISLLLIFQQIIAVCSRWHFPGWHV